ncbi:hypothetical protein Poli38472_011112 [Pythium oligandrum]|uniref:Uncharacterized protein n=1 Tax=Pythium oligandrum TaxID=41045 RepID=A0A8K1CPP5_PYTOL|nr:hypothetical protein Poli38472_011112 [Pythium oligandrum]|eukprot:TMW67492.1 hypothetical protein Poli38472_011112 [Pythium oligandrum]
MSKLSALAIPYVLILDGDAAKAQQTLVSPHPAFVTFASKTPGLAEMTEREDDMQLHAAGRTFVTVKRTAKLRMEPKTRALIIDISKAAIDRPLEVVVTLSKWTCVIVPGYGFGWVGNAVILTRDEPFRENPASHQLLTLVFDYNSDDHEQLERLLSAIKTHSTLEYLLPYQLLLSDEPPKHEVFDTLDGQTISILGPPRNTKLAFLSVIGRKLQTTSNAALHHLDVVLVSKIFAFSGTPVKRHVHREHQANMSLSRFAYW